MPPTARRMDTWPQMGIMRQVLLTCGSILLFVTSAYSQAPSSGTSRTAVHDSSQQTTTAAAETLLALSQQWVGAWNERDVDRMADMHGDVARTIYIIGETSSTVEWLLREIRNTNFWDLSWKIHIVKPHVRVLSAEAGLVSFRLVGEEASARGTKPFSAAFTLVYQKLAGEWKIVHVQDSSRLETPAR